MLIAEDWLLGGLVDRRMFLSVSGAALAGSDGLSETSTDDPLVEQIETSVPRLQPLDDEPGELRRRKRNHAVAGLLPELETALGGRMSS